MTFCSPPLSAQDWSILPEWIEYHLLIGVQHIYLYTTNGSRDELARRLRKYVTLGKISLQSWMSQPWTTVSHTLHTLSARNDCLYRNRDGSKWLSFVDVNEYLYPEQSENLQMLLESYLNKTKTKVLKLKRFYFARPKTERQKSRLLIESYRRDHLGNYNGREKYVVQPQNVSSISMQHGDLNVLTNADHVTVNRTILRVNHYKTGFSQGKELDAGMKRFIPRVKAYLCRRLGQCL
uniref:Glycosyltransferase family 92 protein n=1 Tax=Saccoglossus kowalevskii TaxID=10224 RepID=A0ABM0MJ67_SACKO|nr:PREDICTED: UPF0392 protein Os08g0121900-like [Saccoglossus kowalevskii]